MSETRKLEKDAWEVLEVARELIAVGKASDVREAEAAFYQTHISKESTEVRIRVKF